MSIPDLMQEQLITEPGLPVISHCDKARQAQVETGDPMLDPGWLWRPCTRPTQADDQRQWHDTSAASRDQKHRVTETTWDKAHSGANSRHSRQGPKSHQWTKTTFSPAWGGRSPRPWHWWKRRLPRVPVTRVAQSSAPMQGFGWLYVPPGFPEHLRHCDIMSQWWPVTLLTRGTWDKARTIRCFVKAALPGRQRGEAKRLCLGSPGSARASSRVRAVRVPEPSGPYLRSLEARVSNVTGHVTVSRVFWESGSNITVTSSSSKVSQSLALPEPPESLAAWAAVSVKVSALGCLAWRLSRPGPARRFYPEDDVIQAILYKAGPWPPGRLRWLMVTVLPWPKIRPVRRRRPDSETQDHHRWWWSNG